MRALIHRIHAPRQAYYHACVAPADREIQFDVRLVAIFHRGRKTRRDVRAALSRAVALPARACLLAVDASHLRPQPDDLYDVDRKQHGVKKKHGIKLSCDAVEDE